MPPPTDTFRDTHTDRPRTGLTLSGGGFRATLFHLGVVRFLREEKLLHKVTHICSVSGGSILAAHLVLNWERYTHESDAEFEEAAGEVVQFVRSDLRGRVLRTWLLSWAALGLPRLRNRWWHRTEILQREYDRLFRGARLKDLVTPTRPQLHLLCTSFTTGHLVAFGQKEMRFCGTPVAEPEFMPASQVPVALAVAASSAFPPLFPPVRVDHTTFGADKPFFPHRHYLTDGGVYDNLGVRRLILLFGQEERLEMLVVSDAQRCLAKDFGAEYSLVFGRTSRCVDLMMSRVGTFENSEVETMAGRLGARLIYAGLPKTHSDVLKQDYAPADREQFAVAAARTDLDRFTDDEIDAIVHQGYATACAAAEAKGINGPRPTDRPLWHRPRQDRTGGYHLGGIDRRKLGLFRPGHWVSWALWGLVVLWVTVPFAVFLLKVDGAHQGKRRLAPDNYMRAIRMLGDVALATSNKERYESRKADWMSFKEHLRTDAEFHSFLAEPKLRTVEDDVIHTPPPFPVGSKEKVRGLAKWVRKTLQESGEDEYLAFQRSNRGAVYQEIYDATTRITRIDDLTKTESTRRLFWRHYWGPIVLVQKPETDEVIESYAALLQAWERPVELSNDQKTPAQPNPDLKDQKPPSRPNPYLKDMTELSLRIKSALEREFDKKDPHTLSDW